MLLDELLIWRRTDPRRSASTIRGLASAGHPAVDRRRRLVETLAKVRAALRMAETLAEVAHHQPYAPRWPAGRLRRSIQRTLTRRSRGDAPARD
jgi:hypothetical protein